MRGIVVHIGIVLTKGVEIKWELMLLEKNDI